MNASSGQPPPATASLSRHASLSERAQPTFVREGGAYVVESSPTKAVLLIGPRATRLDKLPPQHMMRRTLHECRRHVDAPSDTVASDATEQLLHRRRHGWSAPPEHAHCWPLVSCFAARRGRLQEPAREGDDPSLDGFAHEQDKPLRQHLVYASAVETSIAVKKMCSAVRDGKVEPMWQIPAEERRVAQAVVDVLVLATPLLDALCAHMASKRGDRIIIVAHMYVMMAAAATSAREGRGVCCGRNEAIQPGPGHNIT
jgi:hypothetical protein